MICIYTYICFLTANNNVLLPMEFKAWGSCLNTSSRQPCLVNNCYQQFLSTCCCLPSGCLHQQYTFHMITSLNAVNAHTTQPTCQYCSSFPGERSSSFLREATRERDLLFRRTCCCTEREFFCPPLLFRPQEGDRV